MKTAMLFAAVMLAAVPAAHALSEWWAPMGKKCPAFDSEEACERWCTSHPDLCGSDQCNFQVAPQVPECPPPAN